MALEDYVRQSSLRFHSNGTLIRPARQLALDQYTGSSGTGTYLAYEGPVNSPAADVEDVPFYGRRARNRAAPNLTLFHIRRKCQGTRCPCAHPEGTQGLCPSVAGAGGLMGSLAICLSIFTVWTYGEKASS